MDEINVGEQIRDLPREAQITQPLELAHQVIYVYISHVVSLVD
jgi:hypothetical protein